MIEMKNIISERKKKKSLARFNLSLGMAEKGINELKGRWIDITQYDNREKIDWKNKEQNHVR